MNMPDQKQPRDQEQPGHHGKIFMIWIICKKF